MILAEIVPATKRHIVHIAENAREDDIAELWASGMTTPRDAMRKGLLFSDYALAGLVDGVPVCIWGVKSASLIGSVGHPWMIASNQLDRVAIPFLRRNGDQIKDMLSRYKHLYNYVDARNKKTIRWLKWLGFTFEEAVPYGPFGMPFHKFYMGGQNV